MPTSDEVTGSPVQVRTGRVGMAAVEQDCEHVEHLGVFVLDALSSEEDRTVARHLAVCPECEAEAAGLQDVRRLLDRLSEDDVDELIRRHNSVPHRPQDDSAQPKPGPPNHGSRGARPPRGPSGKVPAVKRTSGRRSRWSLRTRAVLASVVVALGVGTGIGAWLATRGPVEIQLAGAQTDSQSGVSVSVTVVGSPSGAHVEAVIQGLTMDEAYRLYAVGDHGDSEVAAAWTGTGSVQGVAGDVTIQIERLTAVTLARSDGQVIVTVHLSRSLAQP